MLDYKKLTLSEFLFLLKSQSIFFRLAVALA